MESEDEPRYVACYCDLTVEHILIECGDISEVRQRYYDAENLLQLVRQISVTYVFDLLCDIGLLYSIWVSMFIFELKCMVEPF